MASITAIYLLPYLVVLEYMDIGKRTVNKNKTGLGTNTSKARYQVKRHIDSIAAIINSSLTSNESRLVAVMRMCHLVQALLHLGHGTLLTTPTTALRRLF